MQASHQASIIAIANRAGEATLLATEEFRGNKIANEIQKRLERAGWKVTVGLDTGSNIQNRYHSKTGESGPTVRSVSSFTAIFDQHLKEAIAERAVELRYHVRGDTCGVVHNIDGRVYKAMSIDPAQGRGICSNSYTSLADRKSLEAGKNTFNAEQDQSCVIEREIDGARYKLRYQSLPEADGGFDVTMRILPQGSKGDVPSLEKLDFTPSAIRIFERAMRRRNGAVYMSGPVGGGKTTALYAGLYRPQDKRKDYVLTFEDPPEYDQYGITRVPVEKIGYANAVKRALRMGAHKVMIGEIRDHEMGFVAKVLSETGQKVVSTVHVNNANQIMGRLCGEEIGLPRQTMCDMDMVAGLFYTMLLPRLCDCKLHATTENLGPRLSAELARLGVPLNGVRVPNVAGCGKCKEGRRGRVPIVEMIEPDENYLRLMRDGRDGDARDYWLSKCTTPVTDEDVTGKPKMATALYRVAIGQLHVEDLEEGIDLLDDTAIASIGRRTRSATGPFLKSWRPLEYQIFLREEHVLEPTCLDIQADGLRPQKGSNPKGRIRGDGR
jgi:type II secretory ATPase GspE/PulE/Tfp pilus assembly ATPase PilB-like protein